MSDKYRNLNYLVVSHTSGTYKKEFYGPNEAIFDFFVKKKVKIAGYLRYPLRDNQSYKTRIVIYKKGRFFKEYLGFNSGILPLPLRYIYHVLATIFWIFKLRKESKKIDIYVGCDNLNAFSGLLLRGLGLVRYVVFYTIDYAPKRFKSPFLNGIYHWCDRWCIKRADQVWNNSYKTVRVRQKQGVSENRSIHVPHGIDPEKIKHLPFSQINRHTLVISANITKALGFELILDAFAEVLKTVEKAKFKIIGSGYYEQNVEDYVRKKKLGKHVTFLGRMEHDQLLKFLPKCGAGLAIYTNHYSWNVYSDSLKVKEYLGSGLPVIMSGAEAAQEETKDSGAVLFVNLDKKELFEAMYKLLSDDTLYEGYRKNAIKFAESRTWDRIYSKPLDNLLQGRGCR